MPKLTKTFVDNVKPPESGSKIHWDTGVPGYGLRVSAGGKKSFIAQGRVRNKPVCFTIGAYGLFTEAQARDKARSILQGMREGKDPRDSKKENEAASVTLQQVCDEYVARPGKLKESSATEIKRHVNTSFEGWEDRKIASITEDDCRKRYRQILRHGSRGDRKNGAPGQAAQAFAVLRALINFAMRRYKKADGTPLIPNNPVLGLQDEWVPLEARDTYIPPDRIGHVWNYLTTTRAEAYDRVTLSALDLVMFLLLTGARLREASELTWSRVSLDESWWYIGDANSKTGNALWLPLSKQAVTLLRNRPRVQDSDYVFPGKVRETCVKDPRALWQQVSKIAGEKITAHDCRRSFTTYGVAHCDIDLYKVELLTSHKPKTVTMRHYLETKRLQYLQPEVQRIADFIEQKAEQASGANVIPLSAKMS